jgi:hypothetical protein
MLMKLKGESWFCLVLLLLFAYILYASIQLPAAKGSKTDVGARFFPVAISSLLVILTAVVFIRGLLDKGEEKKSLSDAEPNQRMAGKSALVIITLLIVLTLYIFFLPRTGFLISTAIFLILLNLILVYFSTSQIMKPKQFGLSVVFFCLIAVGIYYIFNNFFQLVLP